MYALASRNTSRLARCVMSPETMVRSGRNAHTVSSRRLQRLREI